MSSPEFKRAAAAAAIEAIPQGCVLGVGTGSTVNCLIDLLPSVRNRIDAVVPSSEETNRRLEIAGFSCKTLDAAGCPDVYIDGADEVDGNRQLIKGGGGAHAREKLLASVARRFVVIADAGKRVERLGRFPLPVEVMPMARGHVARQLAAMGGTVAWREGVVTDNGNWLLDVRLLDLTDAVAMEDRIKGIVGVLESGLFARRTADHVIFAGADGIRALP